MPPTLRDFLSEAPFSLALSAGFFGFFAHAGVLSVLEEAGLRPSALAGSSAGALVGAFYASGFDTDALREELFRLERAHFWDPAVGPGLLRGKLFRDLLESRLHVRDVAATRIPFAVSVFDVATLRTRAVRIGPLAPAVQASCAVPLMFRPVRVAGRLSYDGGLRDWAGIAGLPSSGRTLCHYLLATTPGPGSVVPAASREGMVIMTLGAMPAVGPFRLREGRAAFDVARARTKRALDATVECGLVAVG